MTREEYIKLFHRAEANLVAFKPVFHCDDELRRMVEMAIEDEREACAKVCEDMWHEWLDSPSPEENVEDFYRAHKPDAEDCAKAIRARGER
jgi:hypothetical protein